MAVLVCGFMSAQEKVPSSELSIRGTTRVVLVDAIVTDGTNPVRGLSSADFTVLEDGKPQKVAFFSFESATRRANAKAPPALRPGVFTNRPEYHDTEGPL